jgi:8-oxo-dGTP pyrophosphatase MutT (NUDIX family)
VGEESFRGEAFIGWDIKPVLTRGWVVCVAEVGGAMMIAMENELRQALSRRQKQPITDAKLVPSAVLVPLYNKEGQYHVLFTQRTNNVKEHKGQISFPGGARQEGDKTLLDTALRESAEEIGMAPGRVKILGELDDTITTTSNYIVTPFVGIIPWPYEFQVDGWETEAIIEVPISALMDKNCLREETEVTGGQAVTSYFYHYQGRVIWGATARILHQFLDILARVERTA